VVVGVRNVVADFNTTRSSVVLDSVEAIAKVVDRWQHEATIASYVLLCHQTSVSIDQDFA
jgi:hypothetical protein